MSESIYILVKLANVTPRMVNLSTSWSADQASTLPDGRVILEFPAEVQNEVLDHVWYTALQVRQIRQDLESQGSQSRWWWPF